MFYLDLMNSIILILSLLLGVSFFTLFERKLLSYLQSRLGPNKVGVLGIFQAFADGMKLFTKELMFVYYSNKMIYYFSCCFMFFLSLFIWILFPYWYNMFSFKLSWFLFFCIMSLNVYPLMFIGYSGFSIFSLLGSFRSIAQTISYEVSMVLIIVSFLLILDSFDMMTLKFSLVLMTFLFPLSLILYVSFLAELNRTPFDFSEGESELVSGYNIEFMSGGFALIFLGEYMNIIFLSLIFSLLNFKGSELFFFMFLYIVIFIRSLLPRLRYDKLMYLVWLSYLPLTFNFLLFLLALKLLIFN